MEDKLSFGKALMNKVSEILGYSVSADKKLNQLHQENAEIYKMISDFYKIGIRTQVPYMTPKQLVSMHSRGCSIEELSALSGYSIEEVEKKIAQYRNV
jgi:hypothetical protein